MKSIFSRILRLLTLSFFSVDFFLVSALSLDVFSSLILVGIRFKPLKAYLASLRDKASTLPLIISFPAFNAV